jgi:cytochrome c biogenesis protein CcmG/thiol:disulfide interchange protein DsbE
MLMLFGTRPSAVHASFQAAATENVVPHGTPDTIAPQSQRKDAPDFTLTDANGKPITLSAYKGKVVLLDFWATWCGGCKIEIPWYIEFDKKYSEQGLAVIGVSMDTDGWASVKPFLAKKMDAETGGNIAMQYPVVIGTDDIARQYNLKTLPVTLLIDRDGKIAIAHTGLVDKSDFENNIRSLLK